MSPEQGRVPRGFPNLAIIRQVIGLLIPRIKSGALPPPKPPWQGWSSYNSKDHILSAQGLAVEVAKVYDLKVGTLVVTFGSLKSAANVELGPSDDYFIEVDNQFTGRPKELGAVLGHELAHIFLHRAGIHGEDTWSNEILTDTTAAIYGFGALMADSFTVTETERIVAGGVEITRQERALGYLTPDELGYVLTRCTPNNIAEYLSSSAARTALRRGRRVALRETSSPPLAHAPLQARLLYQLKRLSSLPRVRDGLPAKYRYGFGENRVSFRCPLCCQGIRLPLKKRLKTSCPRCELEMRCQT